MDRETAHLSLAIARVALVAAAPRPEHTLAEWLAASHEMATLGNRIASLEAETVRAGHGVFDEEGDFKWLAH